MTLEKGFKVDHQTWMIRIAISICKKQTGSPGKGENMAKLVSLPTVRRSP